MKKIIFLFISVGLVVMNSMVCGQPLAGTDELGRTLLQNDAVGDPKPNRQVVMFYFLWQGDRGSVTSENSWDLHELSLHHPEVFEDGDNPNWGSPRGRYYFWGKPVYGYYRGDDYWVHFKNIQLLTDAGVDLLAIDATNRLTYPKQSEALMKAMDDIRAQGKNPPKIVFYTNTRSGEAMQEIYDNCYKEGAPYRHPDCWFYLDGKPLIIGVTGEIGDRNYKDFFTFRESQWPTVSQVVNGWPWISFTRAPKVHFNSRGEKEIINVSVAQHPNPTAGMGGSAFYGNMDNWGRSYRKNTHGNPETDMPYGYNFQEQWDEALKQNTSFVFVTGWNEWIAGRWASMDDNPEHSWFCDQASPEYSRDIEPTLTANLKDHYYMQLVNNIRRYKGIEKDPDPGQSKSIKNMNDWKEVSLQYTDYTGDTKNRNHPGAQSKPETIYTNTTGRNDFHIMKVARDKRNIYFYVETAGDITPPSGDNWMRLYIDTDRNPKTGWYGYNYRIVEGSRLQHYENGTWKDISKKGPAYQTEKHKMMISIPRSLLNLSGPIDIEFKWSDNMQEEDPMDWYVNGDVAPGGRFNYIFTE
ncbi:MAG: hypothetical protein LBQ60_07115 [Bacteroidales bacterium]|jgi:hypothetical protein|nr:hypothetical protein [Bacteroidales bacterium]